MTLQFSMTPAKLISTSQTGGITLQMLAKARQTCCWSLIEMCGTICVTSGQSHIVRSYSQ
jgi:hypothetical protein